MSEITVELGEIKLNNDDKSATIYRFNQTLKEVFIPRSIEHESQEYIITDIMPNPDAFNLEKIQFAPD